MPSVPAPYHLKPGPLSSHGRIVSLLERLGPAARVLDVGTATGYLGAALRQHGFTHLAGIEPHPHWAAQARAFYESVAELDIERDPWPWPPGTFDAVVCADVLEHLREPQEVLRRLLPLVKPGGWMMVSLPNVAHWSVRMSLLCGRFDYTDNGILDRSHLRFFTLATAQQLLRRAGLAVRRTIPTPLPVARWCTTMPHLSLWWRALERLDGCLGRVWPSMCAYQFVFVARVPEASPGPSHD